MAEDQLKLDIIVDDHGGVKTLADVDAGVQKVVGTAAQATPEVAKLSSSFLGLSGGLAVVTGATAVAAPVITYLSSQLRAAAEDAGKFSAAADLLQADASRIQALTIAAEGNGVGVDSMIGALTRLQERLGSGKINSALAELHLNLDQIKRADITEQVLLITEAINEIPDPLERASARAKIFKGDAEEMGRAAKAGFREAADGAQTMSKETIQALDDISKQFDRVAAQMKAQAKNLVAEAFVGMFNAFKDMRQNLGVDRPDLPTLPGRPGQPEPLPTAPDNPGWAARNMALLDEQLQAQHAITEEGFRQDAVFRSIAQAQALIVKSGGDWADVLSTRVSTAVDAINAKLVNAVMMNTQLTSGAQAERDRLTAKLTATTDPNASAFDKRFNEIDQQHKDKMAAVDQTDRVSAAQAENAIWEETNLKILELGNSWDNVIAKTDDARVRGDALKSTYEQLAASMQPAGGTALPGGLVMPTAEQIANHRYYGPVTPTGQPDPARMGGAAPITNTFHINASGSVFESVEDFVRRIEQGLAERERNQGARTGR